MMKHEEDEIQVLGVPTQGKKTGWRKWSLWYMPLAIAVIIGACWLLLWNTGDAEKNKVLSDKESDIPLLMKNEKETAGSKTNVQINILADTVNDVPMQIFILEGVDSELEEICPDINAEQIFKHWGSLFFLSFSVFF